MDSLYNQIRSRSLRLTTSLILPFIILLALSGASVKPRLVWSDEFDRPGSPDPAKWVYDIGTGPPEDWGNHELEYYTDKPENVRVENGMLVIEARKDSVGKKGFTSGRIRTRGKGDWTHGRILVRAKLPEGRGTWSAIWMLPTENRYGGWPQCGEIDIMEHVGFDPGVIHGTIHTEKYNHMIQTQKEGMVKVEGVGSGFHEYGLDWNEDHMDFLVDGKSFYRITRDASEDFRGWPFDQPFHLILNLAVGGDWGGRKGVDPDIWPSRMLVDWVRVYQ